MMLSAGFAMNRIAKSFKECFDCIAMYRVSGDSDELLKSAWIYTYGVQNSLEKWNFNPFTAKIYVPDYPQLGRCTIDHLLMMYISSMTQLGIQAGVTDIIDKIVDGGDVFNQYSYLISATMKDKLRP